MSKCMYQECCCEATMTIPCIIGPKEIKYYIHVCNYHFYLLTRPEPFVSMELKLEKDNRDGLSNLEMKVKEELNELRRLRRN